MLVIKSRGRGMRRYCYGGSGVFDTIGRKMFSSGLKTAISSSAKSAIAQKIADAVVNGATSATQKAAETAVNEVINTVTPYVKKSVKKLAGKKRPLNLVGQHIEAKIPKAAKTAVKHIVSKIPQIDINSLIDGSGIVLD